jgi:PPOX class probable F420-dependent enzyme
MSVSERIAGASNRLYDSIRSSRAKEAEQSEERVKTLDGLEGHKYCLVTTYKRSGDAVPTPVWFGLDDGRLYFRTYAEAVKIKRIRNNPRVLVGPCDVRGNPKGPMVKAKARVLPKAEEPAAERVVQSNYGLFRRLYEKGFAMRVEGAYVEVTPE